MKKIDGLKIDYTTGDAGICLPAEFRGQTAEFRMMAIGYWIISLENERDQLAVALSKSSKGVLKNLDTSSTIEEMLDAGEMIVFMSKPHQLTHKKFIVTFQLSSSRKHLTAWESGGYATYAKLADVPVNGNSLKGFKRRASQAFEAWSDIQTSLLSMGAGRIDPQAARITKTPRHLAEQILLP